MFILLLVYGRDVILNLLIGRKTPWNGACNVCRAVAIFRQMYVTLFCLNSGEDQYEREVYWSYLIIYRVGRLLTLWFWLFRCLIFGPFMRPANIALKYTIYPCALSFVDPTHGVYTFYWSLEFIYSQHTIDLLSMLEWPLSAIPLQWWKRRNLLRHGRDCLVWLCPPMWKYSKPVHWLIASIRPLKRFVQYREMGMVPQVRETFNTTRNCLEMEVTLETSIKVMFHFLLENIFGEAQGTSPWLFLPRVEENLSCYRWTVALDQAFLSRMEKNAFKGSNRKGERERESEIDRYNTVLCVF